MKTTEEQVVMEEPRLARLIFARFGKDDALFSLGWDPVSLLMHVFEMDCVCAI
jgi:hypothetical protein